MNAKHAILPCNGLDKNVGQLARELALKLAAEAEGEIICPVLLNTAPSRYERATAEMPLLVIDGCPTRCATKLANRLGLRIDEKVLVTDEAKEAGVTVEEGLTLGPIGLALVARLAADVMAETGPSVTQESSADFETPVEFITVTHDKYIFKIPAEGFHFNENDCWARVIGDRARVGVSDYVQQSMTDITFFEPPKLGAQISQFDDVGSIESAKAVMDAISPVSGKVVAVNDELVDRPEMINEDPYGKGWIAELELGDFESDKELLLTAEGYSPIVKKKAAEAQH